MTAPTPSPTCGTCRYWNRVGPRAVGGCRRFPPVGFKLPWWVRWTRKYGRYLAHWPMTEPGAWCGEHQQKDQDQ